MPQHERAALPNLGRQLGEAIGTLDLRDKLVALGESTSLRLASTGCRV